MFYAVTAAAVEVASPTVGPPGQTDALRHLREIGRREWLAFERLGLVGRMPGIGRELLVGAGLVMADETVDAGLIGEIERFVLPTVAGMATGAARQVGDNVAAKAVDDVTLAKDLAGMRVIERPRPVDRCLQLFASAVMAGEAGGGHLWAACERSLQFLHRSVVGGGNRLAVPSRRGG